MHWFWQNHVKNVTLFHGCFFCLFVPRVLPGAGMLSPFRAEIKISAGSFMCTLTLGTLDHFSHFTLFEFVKKVCPTNTKIRDKKRNPYLINE